MAGIRAGARRRIPADGSSQVLDTVIVRRSIYRRSAVAAAVAGGTANPLTRVVGMLAGGRRDGMTTPAGRSRGRRGSNDRQSAGDSTYLG